MITEKDIGKRVLVEKGDIHWPDGIPFPQKGKLKGVFDLTVAIEMDMPNHRFNDCNGRTTLGYGYYVYKYQCTIIDEPLEICEKNLDQIREELLGMKVNAVEFLIIEKLVEKTMDLKIAIDRFKAAKEAG